MLFFLGIRGPSPQLPLSMFSIPFQASVTSDTVAQQGGPMVPVFIPPFALKQVSFFQCHPFRLPLAFRWPSRRTVGLKLQVLRLLYTKLHRHLATRQAQVTACSTSFSWMP